jgi:hypothetical protein
VPVPELHVTPWLAATAMLDREVALLLVKDTVVVAGALPELHTLPPVPVSVTDVAVRTVAVPDAWLVQPEECRNSTAPATNEGNGGSSRDRA